MKKTLSTLWFKHLTSTHLIYNTCWEDPIIDRFLLEFDSNSDIFMISSAGDNSFDYLLDQPASIDCVDINPYQNSLLDLKCALFKNGSHEHLIELFLTGKTHNYTSIFKQIESDLDDFSSTFWESKKHWFSPNKGFYLHGLTGMFARFLKFLLKIKGLDDVIEKLMNEHSLEQRTFLYEECIKPTLWKGFSKHLWKSELILGFAGIPNTQSDSIPNLNEYIKSTIQNLFVTQGMQNNYFWRLYLEGKYSTECCPNYLKEDNFANIQSQIHKLSHSNDSVTTSLISSEKKYSHFILLDHQDWLIADGTNELESEWTALLHSAKPKAKILFRSVHKNLDFLPEFVKKKTRQISVDQNYLLENDRVGTYPSTFLLEANV
ncbi:MAG: BtaA family protein [Balneola sp.]